MVEIDFEKIGLKVGLEIHQQLNTNKKLFCKCKPIESDEYTEIFSRRLRTAKRELGELDPAALFEKTKSKKINYYANSQSSCLVEKDEEPPHDLDHDAKKISLLISSMLESKIFSEIHVMRKTVIDGSNTTGFQRTMLVSQGGNLKVNGKKIGVQAVCLEEDAAKLLKDEQNDRYNERHQRWRELCESRYNISEIIIAKQRHGPIGTIKAHFDPNFTKFSDLTRTEYDNIME